VAENCQECQTERQSYFNVWTRFSQRWIVVILPLSLLASVPKKSYTFATVAVSILVVSVYSVYSSFGWGMVVDPLMSELVFLKCLNRPRRPGKNSIFSQRGHLGCGCAAKCFIWWPTKIQKIVMRHYVVSKFSFILKRIKMKSIGKYFHLDQFTRIFTKSSINRIQWSVKYASKRTSDKIVIKSKLIVFAECWQSKLKHHRWVLLQWHNLGEHHNHQWHFTEILAAVTGGVFSEPVFSWQSSVNHRFFYVRLQIVISIAMNHSKNNQDWRCGNAWTNDQNNNLAKTP
jgi:hypothetical protein